MKRKNYTGYKSYQFLEPGVDYRAYDLAKEIGRVPSRGPELNATQEARAKKLFEDNIVISLHEHTFVAPADLGEFWDFRRGGRDATGYAGLAASGLDAVFDNFMDGTAMVRSRTGWQWDDIIYDIGLRYSDLAHQDFAIKVERTADIRRARETGRIGFVSSIEGAAMIENELDRLDILFGFGVRCMGVCYSEANALGCGIREPNDSGLTVFGQQAVRRMNKLGYAIDVSHAGDRTSLDTIKLSKDPIFITHAGARALWNSNRMKPDDVLKACAERGGVIGVEAAPHTSLSHKHPNHCLDSVMDHFEYLVDLVGIDHVTFGPDTLFGDHVGLHHVMRNIWSPQGTSVARRPDHEEVPFVNGIENPAEGFPNIVRWLVLHNYSDTDIAKVIGGNTLRLLDQVWPK
jgi:membrane dipeptidase